MTQKNHKKANVVTAGLLMVIGICTLTLVSFGLIDKNEASLTTDTAAATVASPADTLNAIEPAAGDTTEKNITLFEDTLNLQQHYSTGDVHIGTIDPPLEAR